MIVKATETLSKINAAIFADQGASFRKHLRASMPLAEDAYREESEPFRTHLGASLIGRECARELWYSFRWAHRASFEGRILRLFNRGHLEEARFVALLQMIGCEVWQHTDDGRQFRMSAVDGHFGGSLDCVIRGLPEYPTTPVVGEFKTHSDKSFNKLTTEGVRSAKFEHFVQMQIYMGSQALDTAIYLAVNKNDDDIWAEYVKFDPELFEKYLDRAQNIIDAKEPPKRLNDSPGWYKCKFCDMHSVCHSGATAATTCRTCVYAEIGPKGWYCTEWRQPLDKKTQFVACASHQPIKL